MSIKNKQIWDGIELLASKNNWSVSRLAEEAGLDPTCFNRSKRQTSTGQVRSITTESLCKILNVTNTKLSSFARMIERTNT